MKTRVIWLAMCVLCVAAGKAPGQWSALASKVPAASNAIVLMDVEKVMASPIAKREGWRQRFDKSYAAGLIAVPPTTNRVLLAAQLDYETWHPMFELALLELDRDISVVNIARQTKGAADTVAGLNAVVLSEDAYIVELDPRRVAGLAPANRQAAVRWLRESLHRDQPNITQYLGQALKLADTIELVQALDMEDAVPADVIRAKLKTSNVVSSAKPAVDIEHLVALLSTLKGATFEVVFKDDVHARFLIDFGQDAALLARLGKPLLLEILRKQSAWIEDFESWTPSVRGEQFVLTGTLTPSGMRKVFSLIDAPVATFASPAEHNPNADASSLMASATYSYFKSLSTILDDLKKESKDSVTLGQNAAWLDRWARKIERLPMLNVDNDMLDYGGYVVANVRGASDALKGIGINSARRSSAVYNSTSGWVSGGYSGYYGRYVGAGGYFEDRSVDNQRRAIRTEERTNGAANALANCRTIEGATAAIRRTMTQRYKIEF